MKLQPISKNKYRVCEKFSISMEYREKPFKFEVPLNYTSNGASIPKLFWNIFPPFHPSHIEAAIVHDYLTDLACEEKDLNQRAKLFKRADYVMKSFMKNGWNTAIKINIFYYSCRVYHIAKIAILKLLRRFK